MFKCKWCDGEWPDLTTYQLHFEVLGLDGHHPYQDPDIETARPDVLREAAQAVVDAWDADEVAEEDGFDPMVESVESLRAALNNK